MTDTFARIQERQGEWALQHKGRAKFTDYQDNLFEELKPDAKNEYSSGDGHELARHMYSLISSSALCCNFFHYWRYHNPEKLCEALGIHGDILQLRFETKPAKPAGIGGPNPNIDVLIASGNHELTTIECKFSEPYQHQNVPACKPLLESYFYEGVSVWERMPGCFSIAKLLPKLKQNDEPLRHLAADQLIKHAVGLLNTYPWKNWRLIYLWYDSGSDDDKAHRNEIGRFKKAIGNDFRFENMTYQVLFSRLCETPDTSTSGWAHYMRERYF